MYITDKVTVHDEKQIGPNADHDIEIIMDIDYV